MNMILNTTVAKKNEGVQHSYTIQEILSGHFSTPAGLEISREKT